jgi:hypothetical protein
LISLVDRYIVPDVFPTSEKVGLAVVPQYGSLALLLALGGFGGLALLLALGGFGLSAFPEIMVGNGFGVGIRRD